MAQRYGTMAKATRNRPKLTASEIAGAFTEGSPSACPPIISPQRLADIIGVSRSTVYHWIQEGRLDGSFRRRGKHVLIWRDKALAILFNGPDWDSSSSNRETGI